MDSERQTTRSPPGKGKECFQRRTLFIGILLVCSFQIFALIHLSLIFENNNTKPYKAAFLVGDDFRLISSEQVFRSNNTEFIVRGMEHRIVKRELSEAFLTPNEILRRTAIAIKTFNRPDCFKITLKSFLTLYPDIPIFVADDSFDDTLKTTPGIRYIRMPPDSGTGAGRNALVKAIYEAGFEYMVMSDDDYIIDDYDDLLTMAQHMIQTDADVLAPLRCDYGKCDRSKGMIFIDDKRDIVIFPNITQYPPENVESCHRTDIVQQFFLARTEVMEQVHWDDVLKNNDHYDFLYNAKSHGVKLVSCTDVRVLHDKKTCQGMSKHSKLYTETRAKRWFQLTTYVFDKWSIGKLIDEVGKTISIEDGLPKVLEPEKIILSTTHELYEYFISSAIEHMNAKVAGWNWFRPILPSRKNYLFYKQHSPCIYYFRGKLHVEYDRDADVANKQQLITFDTYHYNESCEYAEHLWNMTKYGIEYRARHVYYIVAVANDLSHLLRLLKNLDERTADKKHTTIVIVDMGKVENKVTSKQFTISLSVYLMFVGSPFSRSIGLKKGVEIAIKDARKNNYVDSVAFAIDTSILTPTNFTDTIKRNVRCGVTAYAPIVYKFKQDDDGYWVNPGYGMIGFCLSDYINVGGYDERWGYRWGAEDVDLVNRLSKSLLYIVRPQQEGLFHIHNYHTRKTFKAYYMKKNMYDKGLPLTPQTTTLSNPELERRLEEFISSKSSELKEIPVQTNSSSKGDNLIQPTVLKINSAQKTKIDYGKKVVYDLTLKDNDGRTHWAIVHSVLSAELNILNATLFKPSKKK